MKPPVCPKCHVAYQVERNGVTVLETFLDPPQPYKLWHADLWKCPGCKHFVIVGFADHPYAEHYQADFQEKLQQASFLVVCDEKVRR